jgi:hypothetical protein
MSTEKNLQVRVSLILVAQSYTKRCPVFLLYKHNDTFELPSMSMSFGDSPLKKVSDILQDVIGTNYNEDAGSENWLFPTLDYAFKDKNTSALVLIYSCYIPESSPDSDDFQWKTIADIVVGGEDKIDPDTKAILHKYGIGEAA